MRSTEPTAQTAGSGHAAGDEAPAFAGAGGSSSIADAGVKARGCARGAGSSAGGGDAAEVCHGGRDTAGPDDGPGALRHRMASTLLRLR